MFKTVIFNVSATVLHEMMYCLSCFFCKVSKFSQRTKIKILGATDSVKTDASLALGGIVQETGRDGIWELGLWIHSQNLLSSHYRTASEQPTSAWVVLGSTGRLREKPDIPLPFFPTPYPSLPPVYYYSTSTSDLLERSSVVS